MSLLGSIAAALSEGVGGGMVQNAKWGIAEDEQAKKEAAENSRLEKTLAKYDADRESRERIFADQLEEMKNERLSRAEQAAADRENTWRIANIRASSGGSGGRSRGDAIDDLKMLDLTIRGFDKERADLIADLENETDPGRRTAIKAQVADITQRRGALINGPAAKQIAAMNGEIGAAYLSQYFEPKGDKQQVQQAIPEALIRAPQRPKASDGGLLMRMSNNQQRSTEQLPASQAFTHPSLYQGSMQSMHRDNGENKGPEAGDIWGRIKNDAYNIGRWVGDTATSTNDRMESNYRK